MIAATQRQQVEDALHAFGSRPLREAAIQLWNVLGYESSRTLDISSKQAFRKRFDADEKLREDRASWVDWSEANFCFRLPMRK
jgi:hypothetical protein